jgi:hypothetical protein
MPARKTRTFVLLLIVACAPSAGALAALWIWPGTLGGVVYASCKILLYGIPAVVAFRTIRRADIRAGIRRGFKVAPITFGVTSGILIGALIFALWHWLLAADTDISRLLELVQQNGLDGPVKYWFFAAWLCIGNSLLEEIVFRWFIDSRLRILGLGTVVAMPISAMIFTLHHVIVLTAYFDPLIVVLGSAGVFMGGLIWSYTLLRWRSLVPGWISHALVDLAIFIIGASILGL